MPAVAPLYLQEGQDKCVLFLGNVILLCLCRHFPYISYFSYAIQFALLNSFLFSRYKVFACLELFLVLDMYLDTSKSTTWEHVLGLQGVLLVQFWRAFQNDYLLLYKFRCGFGITPKRYLTNYVRFCGLWQTSWFSSSSGWEEGKVVFLSLCSAKRECLIKLLRNFRSYWWFRKKSESFSYRFVKINSSMNRKLKPSKKTSFQSQRWQISFPNLVSPPAPSAAAEAVCGT